MALSQSALFLFKIVCNEGPQLSLNGLYGVNLLITIIEMGSLSPRTTVRLLVRKIKKIVVYKPVKTYTKC